MLTKTNRVHPCPIDSIRRFSYPLQRHYSIHAFVFLSLSPSDFRLVGSVLTQTDRVHLCPIDSIRRLFLRSANTLLYYCVCFSRSLAVRLPASRLGVDKDESCPSVSDRFDPPIFLPSAKTLLYSCVCFSKSLAIGLPASRVGAHTDGSSPSLSDRLDPPTFPTLCKYITLLLRLFF